MKLSRVWSRAVPQKLLWALLFSVALVASANASHFRYGHLTWQPKASISPTTVEFTLTSSFRRNGYSGSGPDGYPVLGDVITEHVGGTGLNFGDGASTGTLQFKVTAFSATDNLINAVALDPATLQEGVLHTYAASTDNGDPWLAEVDSCCRTSVEQNNPGGNYTVQTLVETESGNSSPVSSLVPIVGCPVNAPCSFLVPANDSSTNAVLSWRLATPAEAGFGFSQPGSGSPSPLGIDPNTGQVTWDTSLLSVVVGQLYSTQVIIEERDADTNDLITRVAVDFLIRITNAGPPPVCTIAPDDNFTVPVGGVLNFSVTGSTPSATGSVILNSAGLPQGSATSPGLPADSAPLQSITADFSWTPSQIGAFVTNFSVTDNEGQQGLCQAFIDVVESNVPPSIDQAFPSQSCLWPPNHKFVPIGIAGVTDEDGDEVTISITQITSDEATAEELGAGGKTHTPDAIMYNGIDVPLLRAERSGLGDGRVYEISFIADDGQGGTTPGTVQVQVPHSRACDAIDSGQQFDATQ